MAYEDLTPQERQALQQSLLAPPPAMFAQAQPFEVDPLTRAQAAAGLLGPQGRFFEQMARQQDEAKLESQAASMAQELMSVSPLEMGKKAQELASRDPRAFASPTVQQALRLGQIVGQEQKSAEQEGKQARETQLAQSVLNLPKKGFTQSLQELSKIAPEILTSPEVQSAVRLRREEIGERAGKKKAKLSAEQTAQENVAKAKIASATPEELDQWEADAPSLLPSIEKRRNDLSEIETLSAQLPPQLRTPENLSRPHKAKAALNKFNMGLPARLRKVEDYSLKQAVVEDAVRYLEVTGAIEKQGKSIAKEDPKFGDQESLRQSITLSLGLDPDKVFLTEKEIETYAKLKPVFDYTAPEEYIRRNRNPQPQLSRDEELIQDALGTLQ
jgi:hypothetical protein